MACQDHPAMRHLYIGANDLTTAVVPSLCVYVQGSTRLETLDISYNFIGRGIIKLLHSVAKSQTLKVLNMSYNAGTESCLGAVKHVLMDSLPTEDDPDPIPSAPRLIELNLEGNQLPPEAGVVIRHVLNAPKNNNTTILHINLDNNFLTKYDVMEIEKSLALNRQGAAFKFRFEPHLLQQKYNWNASTHHQKNIKDKKIKPNRTVEDTKLQQIVDKKKRKADEKMGKGDPKPCCVM